MEFSYIAKVVEEDKKKNALPIPLLKPIPLPIPLPLSISSSSSSSSSNSNSKTYSSSNFNSPEKNTKVKQQEEGDEKEQQKKIDFVISEYVNSCEHLLNKKLAFTKDIKSPSQFAIVDVFFKECKFSERHLTPTVALLAYSIFSIYISNQLYKKTRQQQKVISRAEFQQSFSSNPWIFSNFTNSLNYCFS